MKNLNKKNKGFTLIEILVVIGIIAILAAIVIVAINPKKHFDDAVAAQRDANVNAILNAISQYTVDNKGTLPAIDGTADGDKEEITKSLCDLLVPAYIGALPTDPKSDSEGAGVKCDTIDESNADKDEVLYAVTESAGRVTVCATVPATDICVTR